MNSSKPYQRPLERVFVYGTLKRDEGNHHHIRDHRGVFVGQGVTVSRFPLVVSRLPYLIPKPGYGHRVIGDVFDVPKWGLRALDRLEGHPIWYKREQINVLVTGHVTRAWAYFTQNDDMIRNFRLLPLTSDFKHHMLTFA